MPKHTQIRVARQRPVSCHFCRLRKLRCSREAPCSNCISRGIHCELENAVRSSPETLRASEPELLERIHKLEELVKNQKSQRSESAAQHSEDPGTRTQPGDTPGLGLPPEIEHLENDVAWLASIYCGQDPSQQKTPSNKVVFRICPIQQINGAQPYINQNAYLSSTCYEPLRCVWLPQLHEARILLEKFIEDIDHVHHVLHTPSLLTFLEEFYASLTQEGQVKPGHVILVLAIFATSTHSWVRGDSARGLFSASTEANTQSPLWIKATEDVLDISHRTASISIEGVQRISIAAFVLLNTEGFSRRCKSLFNMAFLLGRDLGLHLLDHPFKAGIANSAQTEIARRVWWYLVASDWSALSRFKSITQGVYQCHPRHMIVKNPLNINDEDLIDGMGCVEQPVSSPTTMSYPLQRIRLSEISRSIVDRSPLVMAQVTGPSHAVVMDIDTELQLLINDIPPFFSMSVTAITVAYQLSPSRAANIVYQGYMLYSFIYAQRCSLHFPYFTRGYTDPIYASSRDICLQSARQVIQTDSRFRNSGLRATTRYKLLGILMPVFLASIIVLMDLCHNKSSSPHEKGRGDIAEAIRIFEEAKHESETAAKFLDSLMYVLRKYKVLPPNLAEKQPPKPGLGSDQHSITSDGAMSISGDTSQSCSGSAAAAVPLDSTNDLGSTEASSCDVVGNVFSNGEDLSSYFSDLAQSFEQGLGVSTFEWNNIFSGIDAPII